MVLPRCLQRTLTRVSACLAGATTVVLLAQPGCGKKVDVTAEAAELEKVFNVTAAPGSQKPVQTVTAPTAQAGSPQASAYVSSALSAVRQNDYAKGVIALQNAQQARGVTSEQLIAVERTKQAIISDLVRRADRGDASAKAALAAIEKSRSQ